MPFIVFLGLSVLDLGPMFATDRQTDVRQTDARRASSLNAPWAGYHKCGGDFVFPYSILLRYIASCRRVIVHFHSHLRGDKAVN